MVIVRKGRRSTLVDTGASIAVVVAGAGGGGALVLVLAAAAAVLGEEEDEDENEVTALLAVSVVARLWLRPESGNCMRP